MPHLLPYYEQEGKRYPRLTRILSILRDPEVEAWMQRIGTKAAQRRQVSSQKRGTVLHKMISQTLLTQKEATLPKRATFEVQMGWQAWLRWYRLNQARLAPQGVEVPCVSPHYGYGCTPDLWEPGMVTDWKTGSRLQAKHWIQIHSEVPVIFGEEVADIRVRLVRLDPAIGDFEEQIRPFDQGLWEMFLKLKDIYVAWYAGEMQPQEERNGRR